MGLGPILPGRLPVSLITSRLVKNLEADSLSLARLQDQISSGKKYFLPGESPTSSIRAIVLQKSLERRNQIQTNIKADRTFLTNSEATLTPVSDLLNQARSALQAGLGDATTDGERVALANEVRSMLHGAVSIANTNFQGRYLFAGSQSRQIPFELQNGIVRYLGDDGAINSYIDLNTLSANNIDGASAFNALSAAVGTDVDPAVTSATRMADLLAGRGVSLGSITITLDDGVNPAQSALIDLTSAETIGDIETRLEHAFAGGPLTLNVDIDPSSRMGLRLTPSAGTITVGDITGSNVARDLGIRGGPSSSIVGSDLDPSLTIYTPLSALNGGKGIGSTTGTGLVIDNGVTSKTVDLSSANTVQDVLNLLRQADLDLVVGINSEGNGISVSSRLSGGRLTIGENGGNNAAGLGIRTMSADTLLADLNLGAGLVQDGSESLKITRRDGTIVTIDIQNSLKIQDIIDAINDVDDLTPSTQLTDLNLGVGVPVTSADLQITQRNGSSLTIDLDSATTMQDILDAINYAETFDGTVSLAELNNGTGVPVNGGSQLEITRRDGSNVSVDLSGSTTLQDVVDLINAVDPGNLVAAIDSTNHRLTLTDNSGVGDLTVAANAVSTALGLDGSETSGVAAIPLAGDFVPLHLSAVLDPDDHSIIITDTSGTGTLTIADNAVSQALGIAGSEDSGDPTASLSGTRIPVKLFARFNQVGNGIEIADASGSGPLVIESNAVSTALGINGSDTGTDPTAFLSGRDVNPQETGGVFSILLGLEQALRSGDDQELSRLDALLKQEVDRFNLVRSEAGSRLKLLDDIEARLEDSTVEIESALSDEIDTDLTEAILRLNQQQANFEMTLKVAAQTFSLNLLNFI